MTSSSTLYPANINPTRLSNPSGVGVVLTRIAIYINHSLAYTGLGEHHGFIEPITISFSGHALLKVRISSWLWNRIFDQVYNKDSGSSSTITIVICLFTFYYVEVEQKDARFIITWFAYQSPWIIYYTPSNLLDTENWFDKDDCQYVFIFGIIIFLYIK